MPIGQLHPWKDNPRKNAKAIAEVAKSIKRFGWSAPLVAREQDGEIIAGHTRYEAALQLKLTEVPVRFLRLEPDEAHMLAIADNRTGEIADWDDAKLAEVLADLRAADVELLNGTGLTDHDLRRLLDDSGGVRGEDPGPTEPPVNPVSRAGELYQLGPHRLLCGDSTNPDDVVRLMGGERAILCATDPPYLVDYDGTNHPQSFARDQAGKSNNKEWDAYRDPAASVDFFVKFIRLALQLALVENAAFYQWHASRRQALVEHAWEKNGLFVHQQLIWVKARPILTRSHFMWQHEPAFYGWVKGKPPAKRPPLGGENTTVWRIDQKGESDGIHPTQKPLEIFRRPISYHTVVDDLVFEPFAGSGSQIIAAALEGRRCYAIELEPAFVDVIRRRWTGYARSAGIDPGPGALG